MADKSAKEKLVDFLERKAFDPVLRARPENYAEGQRAKLAHVQDATRTERERFHRYGSAEKVVQMFKDDLNSEPAQKIHRELRALDLPTLNDFRDEFERLADELGIGR
jgi:hypothetical protein